MFSSSFRTSLVALVASAAAVSAAPGLTVKASIPNAEVDGLGNLKVTTTITNTGDETLKLLNDPRGVLSTFPEDSFTITDTTGSSPLFDGAKVKYSPTYTVSLDDPSVFTVLAPGASKDVIHDLSAAYNFTRTGAGDYSIEPSNLFTYVAADGTPKNFLATVEDAAEVKLSGTLAVSPVHDKRATFVGCLPARRIQINAAASSAQTYSVRAYSYIRGISSRTLRYTTWFGTYTSSRKSIVQDHFQRISSRQFSSFTYDCSTCTAPDTFAYVYPNQFGKIYLCGAFWRAPNTGTDSKAGTLVHESSHFTINGGTKDYVYGKPGCRNLAITNPSRAIFNADSHEYFAENTPALP